MKINKPKKKADGALFQLISEKIICGEYFFTNHAKQRIIERGLLELEILQILNGMPSKKRRRNKRKDQFTEDNPDWNYCIEGMSVNENKIRIIFSFSETYMIIITAILLN